MEDIEENAGGQNNHGDQQRNNNMAEYRRRSILTRVKFGALRGLTGLAGIAIPAATIILAPLELYTLIPSLCVGFSVTLSALCVYDRAENRAIQRLDDEYGIVRPQTHIREQHGIFAIANDDNARSYFIKFIKPAIPNDEDKINEFLDKLLNSNSTSEELKNSLRNCDLEDLIDIRTSLEYGDIFNNFTSQRLNGRNFMEELNDAIEFKENIAHTPVYEDVARIETSSSLHSNTPLSIIEDVELGNIADPENPAQTRDSVDLPNIPSGSEISLAHRHFRNIRRSSDYSDSISDLEDRTTSARGATRSSASANLSMELL